MGTQKEHLKENVTSEEEANLPLSFEWIIKFYYFLKWIH